VKVGSSNFIQIIPQLSAPACSSLVAFQNKEENRESRRKEKKSNPYTLESCGERERERRK